MCGFVGFVDKTTRLKKEKIIRAMNSKIVHRGPDGEGYFVDNFGALGHRRLSILDIDGGCQPMIDKSGRYVLVFNGEIYNYLELKEILEKDGVVLQTKSDSEVLLYSYIKWKEEVCNKLRGMFAFVIYDKKEHVLFGARDQFGMKPFYYMNYQGLFIFASEIKAMLEHPNFVKEINLDALKMYLVFQSSVKEETFFKNVYKLLPGHYFIYKDGKLQIFAYYSYEFARKRKSFFTCKKELQNILENCVYVHKVASDVEVGSYLSGGVDSSYVVSVAKPNKTFSVGFANDGFDETTYAKEFSNSLHIRNYRKEISPDDFFDILPTVMYHADEPHANLSAVPLYFLSQLTKKEVSVVLSGEGADELFGGYNEYYDPLILKIYLKVPLFIRKSIRLLCKKLPHFPGRNTLIKYGLPFNERYTGHGSFMESEEANLLLAKKLRNNEKISDILNPYYKMVEKENEVTKKMFLDLYFWLPQDILLKADKMSMANGVELRTPLLDTVLFSYSKTLPNSFLIHKKTTKYIFREIAKEKMPLNWAIRRKCGFPVPFSKWLLEEKYYLRVKELFTKNYVKDFFDVCFINKILEQHYHGIANHGRKIYNIYCFLVWYEQFFA